MATLREAVGANPAAIQATVDTFRADLGDPLNGSAVGDQGAGRRDINWDGVPDADSAAGRFPPDFFNAIAPRGAIFGGDPRISFQVSADAVNPAATSVEFGNLNATYPTAFATFTAERLFTSLGTNVFDIVFKVAGSPTPAEVDGFGAVFTDVDFANVTKVEYFDRLGNPIVGFIDPSTGAQTPFPERSVLAAGNTNAFLSFTGATFSEQPAGSGATVPFRLARVRITLGNNAIGPNDLTQAGVSDIVVVDDLIYGEPHAQPTPALSFSAASYGAGEADGTATITVERSGDTAATVEVGVKASDGTAENGKDYESSGGALIFGPGETSKTLSVPLIADGAAEPPETVDLKLQGATSNGMVTPTIGPDATATLTITDDTRPACGDTADNDGDGKLDFPADPGCTDAADDDETDPPPDPDPDPDPDPTPDTEVSDPDVTLDKKIFVKGKQLKVKVSTGCQEICSHAGSGKVVDKAKGGKTKRYALKPAAKQTEAGERTILRLLLEGGKKKRQRLTGKIKRSIKRGNKVRAKVTVELSDEAGNSVTEKRVARLKVKK